MNKLERSVWNERKATKQAENQRKKEEEAKLKRVKDEAKKKNKHILKFKPLAERSEPKKIKKRVENNHKLNKEDEDKLYYVGFI